MKYLPIAIHNVAAIVSFTILAIAFYKWWIALFAALFIATSKDEEGAE